MNKDAEIMKRVREAPLRSTAKAPPAEKAIHIPLRFDDVMSAVLKIKPEPKAVSKPKPASKKRTK